MNIRDDIKHQFMHGNAIMKILLVNVLVYAVQSIFYLIAYFAGYKYDFLDFIRTWFGISSDLRVFITKPWTLFTNIVIHNPADIFHLLSNMLYLFFFGRIFIDFISEKNSWP